MLTLESYLQQPLPIKRELRWLFSQEQALTIFEIGCCEGEDTIKYSRLFPKSKIFAFEPLPKNFKLAGKHLQQFGVDNVELINVALSDRKGTAEFFVSSGQPPDKPDTGWDYGNKSSSLLEPDQHLQNHSFVKFETKISVVTDTLESFCEIRKIDQIDFVHMDVQGAELLVLKGAGKWLQNINAVWLEVANVSLYKSQPLAKDIDVFMMQHQFVRVKNKTNKIAGDCLYVHREYLNRLPFVNRIVLQGFGFM
jgi:FkbM family methyltransferase